MNSINAINFKQTVIYRSEHGIVVNLRNLERTPWFLRCSSTQFLGRRMKLLFPSPPLTSTSSNATGIFLFFFRHCSMRIQSMDSHFAPLSLIPLLSSPLITHPLAFQLPIITR